MTMNTWLDGGQDCECGIEYGGSGWKKGLCDELGYTGGYTDERLNTGDGFGDREDIES